MNEGKTVFAQVVACVPHWEFRRVARIHDRTVRVRTFSAWDHFLAMSFAQLTFRESLRDIEACLEAQPGLRHNLGFRSRVTRSTLARVNEQRPWQLFVAIAQKLIVVAREEPNVLELKAPVYALDSTFIDLSLALTIDGATNTEVFQAYVREILVPTRHPQVNEKITTPILSFTHREDMI